MIKLAWKSGEVPNQHGLDWTGNTMDIPDAGLEVIGLHLSRLQGTLLLGGVFPASRGSLR